MEEVFTTILTALGILVITTVLNYRNNIKIKFEAQDFVLKQANAMTEKSERQEKRINELIKQVDEIEDTYETKIAELIAEYTRKLNDLEIELVNVQEKFESSEKQREGIVTEFTKLKSDYDELKVSFSQFKKEHEQVIESNENLKQLVAEKQIEINILNSAIDSLKREKELLEKSFLDKHNGVITDEY